MPLIPSNSRVAFTWLGAGADAARILAETPGLKRLYLVEPRRERVVAAAADAQVQVLLKDPRVRLLDLSAATAPAAVLEQALSPERELFVEGRVGVHFPEAFRQPEPIAALRIEAALLGHVRQALGNVAYRCTHGWHSLENLLLNLPRLPGALPLDVLRGAASGHPAVIVGAGPALDRNLPVLKTYADRVLIVACDAAWKSLDRAGIVPDVVVSTDDGDLVWRLFAAIPPERRVVPLVTLLNGNWTSLRAYQGPLIVGRTGWAADALIARTAGLEIPLLDPGLCVGHAAFEIACLMDANPIILAGFNLAFENDRFHPVDMAAPVFHEKQPDAANLLTVEGLDGKPVRTELSLWLYLKEFERRFAASRRRVLDGTGAGARKQGTQVVDLQATLEQHLRSVFKPTLHLERVVPTIQTPTALPRLPHPSPLPKGEGEFVSCSLTQHPDDEAPPRNAVQPTRDLQPSLVQWREQATRMQTDLARLIHQEQGCPAATGQAPYPILNTYPDLMTLLELALNPVPTVQLRFAREEWMADPTPTRRAAASEAGRLYLADLRQALDLARELIHLLLEPTPPPMNTVGAVARHPTPPPTWFALLDTLRRTGLTVCAYAGDPDDLPAVWRWLRENRLAGIITLDGALLPAAWRLPGRFCLDVRTAPPDPSLPVVAAEYWLPGYGAVCADPALADAWRKAVPADIPVFCLVSDGRFLRTDAPDRSLDGRAVLSALALCGGYK